MVVVVVVVGCEVTTCLMYDIVCVCVLLCALLDVFVVAWLNVEYTI